MDELQKNRKKIDEIDEKLCAMFCERMTVVERIACYKRAHDLPVLDGAREKEILQNRLAQTKDDRLKKYVAKFIQTNVNLSRAFQREHAPAVSDADCFFVESERGAYPVFAGERLLERADEFFDLNRKAFILTDSGVPKSYAEQIAARCKEAKITILPKGEESKSLAVLEGVLSDMVGFSLTRTDCVIAVGGGVVGDLAAFAASVYLRGVDFYNVPTTLLAQTDSSVGGKCGVNFGGAKNVVGAFWQPKGVLIDFSTLQTLPPRQVKNGLAEGIKSALVGDRELFERLEEEPLSYDLLKTLALRALKVKKSVVEADEREGGLRRVLNFGHTLGHAVESAEQFALSHGECVAIGMIPVCGPSVRKRLTAVLKKFDLPTAYDGDLKTVLSYLNRDKKQTADGLFVVFVEEVGKATIKKLKTDEFASLVLRTKAQGGI